MGEVSEKKWTPEQLAALKKLEKLNHLGSKDSGVPPDEIHKAQQLSNWLVENKWPIYLQNILNFLEESTTFLRPKPNKPRSTSDPSNYHQ